MATADSVLWLIIHDRESSQPEVRQHLLNSYHEERFRGVAIASGTEISLRVLWAFLGFFGTIASGLTVASMPS